VHPFPNPLLVGRTGAVVTLNPADKAAAITLTQGNLRAAKTTDSRWVGVRATAGKSSGKGYFEVSVVVTVVNTGTSGCGVGVANATAALDGASTYLGADSNSIGLFTDGTQRQGGSSSAGTTSDWGPAGSSVAVAVDYGARKFWVKNLPSGSWNGDPVAGTGGTTITATGALFPAVCVYASTTPDTIQINFGASAFVGTPPTGYSAQNNLP
jgi:hypothetical protein